MKKRVALVGNSAKTMYIFRGELMKDLIQAGYDVTVIAPLDRDLSIFESDQISFIELPMECRGTNPVEDMKLTKRLHDVYIRERFDFIFHYTIKPVIYGSFAARLTKTPQISVVTGLGYTFIQKGLLNRVAKLLYRCALRSAKSVWFLNEDDRNLFLKEKIVKELKSRIIDGEGINVSSFDSDAKPDKSFEFLYIGRMLWDKGVGEYIKAAQILKKEYPNVSFSLLGPINSENPSAIDEEQMQAWVTEGSVNYLGVTDNIIPFIERCSCVVLPSYREGISRVLLEACSLKRPIVTTNTTGCRDIVTDGLNGYLCEAKDTRSLTDALKKMICCSEAERTRMGESGRMLALEKYDQRIISSIYLSELITL